ncbi:sensor histidine kinase [Dyadobacter fermentans]|uniref:Signal transduction histidine kinase, LytS n=1 Tax=Dyadobacter fermentans (strain ATCC 700827 / DSM 18053 / CIP 107007 / KCTC 52180 / NS114) TaxID=471854 RepID=C6W251_DYAFD|nr:sensor histidine kinase [Dyadobacter fermentans]ACT92024.1 signal transduction histidine kinase, LytS [Dyadobacter fermentans DSM 18053]
MKEKQPARLLANPYLFWVCYWLVWLVLLSNFQPLEKAVWVASANVAAQGLVAFATIRFLVPRFLEKGKYLAYGLLVVVLLLLVTVVYMRLTEPGVQFLTVKREVRYPRAFQFGRMYFLLFVIHMTSTAYKFAVDRFTTLHRQSELLRKQLEMELQVLKNQVNPHFLFNTLNNVYTLAYLKDDNAAPMIMKLSELLRYTLYECQADRVKLGREVAFLQNIIAMQQLKSDIYQKQIQFKVTGVQPDQLIAPLLLLVFVENSFKYADLDTNPDGYIAISINVDAAGTMHFECANTKKERINEENTSRGIGLSNVRKRLELIYPGNHELLLSEPDDRFLVRLTLFRL